MPSAFVTKSLAGIFDRCLSATESVPTAFEDLVPFVAVFSAKKNQKKMLQKVNNYKKVNLEAKKIFLLATDKKRKNCPQKLE